MTTLLEADVELDRLRATLIELRRDLLVADTVIKHLAADEADLLALVAELEDRVFALMPYRDQAQIAIALLADRDRDVARVRAENLHLRAQLRAFISGRTIADERQSIEDEATVQGAEDT